jgi:Cu(I)/Ag(I) efflux system membrane protein CusA/SilA
MALPLFAGMFVELISLFIVPVLYCGYMEAKMNLGLRDRRWSATTN